MSNDLDEPSELRIIALCHRPRRRDLPPWTDPTEEIPMQTTELSPQRFQRAMSWLKANVGGEWDDAVRYAMSNQREPSAPPSPPDDDGDLDDLFRDDDEPPAGPLPIPGADRQPDRHARGRFSHDPTERALYGRGVVLSAERQRELHNLERYERGQLTDAGIDLAVALVEQGWTWEQAEAHVLKTWGHRRR